MALRVGRIEIPSTADRNLQALAREYMTLWNILRPMTTVEYRLDFHLKPDDAEYAMILYELLDDFSKKINDCDDIMLKLVELCWKYSCFDKPIVRDMLNYHSKLVLDASEIICNPEPCHPGLEYLPIDENDTTLDELKDRWRKKSIIVLKLIDTAYQIGEMFPIVPETERIQRDRFRNIANCFKMCNDKIMKLMVYAGVAPFRQGLLRRHLELRTEFRDYKRWFGYSYKFNRVEAELDFFPEWEDIPEPALTRQCIEEFFEVTTIMFLLNNTLQEYKCRYPILKKRLCDQYLQGLQKLDASLEQLRCSTGATEPSVMSLTQLRNAIPIPPKYVWYAKIDFGLFGATRWTVEQFSRMSQRWSI